MGFFSKITNTLSGAVLGGLAGFAVGGPWGAAVGAVGGAAGGYGQDKAARQQEKAMNAQLAAAQKIADAQNPANVITATTPTAQTENAQISEENMASDASRRYSFSKTLYSRKNKLGNSNKGSTATTLG